MELTTLAFGVLVIYVIWNYLNKSKKDPNLPPEPRNGLPIFGNLLSFDGSAPHLTLSKFAEECGDLYTIRMGIYRWVVLNEHNLMRDAFADPLLNGRPTDESFSAFSGGRYGVVYTDTENWTAQKNFTMKHLKGFAFAKEAMQTITMAEVADVIENFKSNEGKSSTVCHKFNLARLNALWIIIFGQKYVEDPDLIASYYEIKELFAEDCVGILLQITKPAIVNLAPRLFGIQRVRDACNRFHKVVHRMIQEHKDTLDVNSPRDFVDQYLMEIDRTTDPKSSFYKEEGIRSLTGIVSDFFQAADEPTLEWVILYLAYYPQIQEKLQEELDRVVGTNRSVLLDDRPNLPYTVALMTEILRKTSVASVGVPHCALEETTLRGYTIPKGSWVVSNIFWIHNNPKVWGDPETFRPERFLEADGKTLLNLEAFTVFSTGKRRCIGDNFQLDQFYLFMTNIFQRFSIRIDPNVNKGEPSFVPQVGNGVVLRPRKYHIIIKDRLQIN